jgi:hypothetical protein
MVWRGPGAEQMAAWRWSGEGLAVGLAAFGQNGLSNQVRSPDRLKLQQLAGNGGRRVAIGKGSKRSVSARY